MKNKLKVYVVGGDTDYANWLPDCEITNSFVDSDVVLFTGGEDVTPAFYGEPSHYTTGCNTQRDNYEQEYYKKAVLLGKYCLGICRGSQFLCVMNEGKLVQHQENNYYRHPIQTYDNKEIIVTSTHHQAQFPYNLSNDKYKILGWTTDISEFHKNGLDNELNPEKECEIVYYPKTKCLGIQSHPEMVYDSTEERDLLYIQYVQELFNKFINNEL